ncbi:MAG: site-specific DNA-methyltransferase [Proteobacteria bacterium]|nr:site-specific DNA-methyltransferase [Pseudomonadota bacterium]
MTRRKQTVRPSEKLFADDQRDMFEQSYEEKLRAEKNKPVECLGMTFPNDEERRNYFLEKLREKLKDPEFRTIEGFPIGLDEDILALSDPPYYTACPNPFIADFIKHYGKPYDPSESYSAKPYAGKLAATRNNPFVNAHSYATKVPHQIIAKLILHFTYPGDIVLDAFGGTGMTAVAGQLCADPKTLTDIDIVNHRHEGFQAEDDNGFRGAGTRHVITGDICPAATFLAANFNLPFVPAEFEREVKRIRKAVDDECGWMHETRHGRSQGGRMFCTLWSDVFVCPECGGEIIFWDAAVDLEASTITDDIKCPHCDATSTKRRLDRAWVTKYDKHLQNPVKQFKQVPVLILYEHDGKRYEKVPEQADLELINKIEEYEIPHWIPTDRMPAGEETRRNDDIGLTHIHHFFTRRNLAALACAWAQANSLRTKFMLTSMMYKSSLLCAPLMSNYFAAKKGEARGGWVGKERSGTLYCPSIHSEVSIWSQIESRHVAVQVTAASAFLPAISTASATDIRIPDNSIDYVFTDPPFGGNKMYSELNFVWEAWLKVCTDNTLEAISNSAQHKGLFEYEALMKAGFSEYYRVLKPGRWITVEFSNTSNAVWNALQNALGAAGFVVADVRTLDKKQGSILGYTTATAARQDLAISAYKPNGGLETRFALEAGTEEGVWDFVRTHLNQLPVFVSKDGQAEVIAERQNYLLFDRMVAFHVQRGVTVPLSAAEFYQGLAQRFPERDGMYFLPEQVAEYDKKRMTVKEVLQLELAPSDEHSSILWLRQILKNKPQTFQEIHPQFLKAIGGWQKHEKPLELSELLEQNLLRYDGKGEVPSQIHSYLSTNFKDLRNLPKDNESLRAKGKDRWYVPDPNKGGDLEKLRERALLREFEDYRQAKQRLLKVFRLEAVRAGFKNAWQERDYATIIAVARKVPENVLQEDPKLLMWYDQALTRTGEE